jgi:hypothetical protein
MARPPIRGVGCWWILRAFGRSMAPMRRASRLTRGVIATARKAELKNRLTYAFVILPYRTSTPGIFLVTPVFVLLAGADACLRADSVPVGARTHLGARTQQSVKGKSKPETGESPFRATSEQVRWHTRQSTAPAEPVRRA